MSVKLWISAAAAALAFAPLASSAQQPAAPRPAAPAALVDKMCADNPPIAPSGSDWTSLGVDANQTRYQPKPGLSRADVPKLKLKWAYSMTGGGMPTVVGDWLFMANRNKFYALDARTGCAHWVSDAAGRTTPLVIRSAISPSGWATFIGERNRTVRAIDAQTGKDIWRSESLESLPVATLTGTPVVSGDRIFVPVSSGEESAARQDSYPCCSFRGSLAALDLKTGKKLWQTSVITEPMRPTRKNAKGVQLQGPAGGAIWSAPTVDEKRGLVYMTTGDSYTEADTKGADAVVAMDIKTGAIRWTNQVQPGDNFIMGCLEAAKVTNCPQPDGPDFDFGATPILMNVAGGKQVLVAGQKSGEVYGIDPATGKTLWKTRVGAGSGLGGVEWGMAADPKRVFVAISDALNLLDEVMRPQGVILIEHPQPKAKSGLYAVDPANGKIVWSTPAPVAPCKYAGDRSRDAAKGACIRAQSAAPSAMPGVVFSGTMDGWFRAYDANTGKIVWEYSTTGQTYDTVNGVKGQPGGSIDGMGPAIAGGMVYTMSGFNGAAQTGGNGVNVLLAFSVDGK